MFECVQSEQVRRHNGIIDVVPVSSISGLIIFDTKFNAFI